MQTFMWQHDLIHSWQATNGKQQLVLFQVEIFNITTHMGRLP